MGSTAFAGFYGDHSPSVLLPIIVTFRVYRAHKKQANLSARKKGNSYPAFAEGCSPRGHMTGVRLSTDWAPKGLLVLTFPEGLLLLILSSILALSAEAGRE